MACNCGGGSHFHENVGIPRSCNQINHVFENNPPAFYGTWNHLYGHEVSNRVSSCQPGISGGLYRQNGPLNCNCCGCTATMLTNVKTSAKIILTITFQYTNNGTTSIDITPGVLYTVQYLENGEIYQCTGMVTNIYKVEQLNESSNIYKIRIDCSTNYNHKVVVIKSDQIRGIKTYIPYQDEDTTLTNALHEYATVISNVIKDAIIIDGELDKNGNILKGTIINGTIEDGRTVDGLVNGTNSSNHNICMRNAQTAGGNITAGIILGGHFLSGDIDGKKEEDTGITTKATIKGILTDVIIINATVSGARTINNSGTVIDTTLFNSRLVDATVSGNDMITTGGITIGNITTNGTSIGGTATGGIASGYIDGIYFNMVSGTTVVNNTSSSTPGYNDSTGNSTNNYGSTTTGSYYNNTGSGSSSSSNNTVNGNIYAGKLVTHGGTVVGGTIRGGTRIGNAIYNATIIGGVCTGGITTGGYTYGGKLIPANVSGFSDIPIIKGKLLNNDYAKTLTDEEKYKYHHGYKHKWDDDLLLMTDEATRTQTLTNLGTAVIERIPYFRESGVHKLSTENENV